VFAVALISGRTVEASNLRRQYRKASVAATGLNGCGDWAQHEWFAGPSELIERIAKSRRQTPFFSLLEADGCLAQHFPKSLLMQSMVNKLRLGRRHHR
jgi:hypothetical protein